ncbi:unnamed protein product [Peronospora belbahrii]|uniref:Uncharacterized protein n=1 Tax=Peronospora belbahrii TaxID=622444 RepID=A0ABN8CNA4_9STRA|nr:unnamed protein product [Peronospora belbahrii]
MMLSASDATTSTGTEDPSRMPHPELRVVQEEAGVDGVNEFSYVSTIDAITALFTVLISRARGHGEDVRVMNAMNARRRLGLPANYAGNVVCSAMATYNASELQSGDEIMTAVSPSNARKAGSTPATIDCTE